MNGHLLPVLAVAVSLLAGCGALTTSTAPPPEPSAALRGSAIEGLYTLPEATLTDTSGKPADLRSRGKWTVLFFGYSNCPDVCTGIVADLATARRRLPAEVSDKVRFVVITTDPARDTPQALGKYLERIDPGIDGLTGSLPAIVKISQQVGVDISRGKELPQGGYEVDHGAQVLVFGPDYDSDVVWTTGTPIGTIMNDLQFLTSQNGG